MARTGPQEAVTKEQRTLFSELKASEGGHGLRGAIALLAANGITATPAPEGSIYIGHIAFYVHGDKRTVERAETLLWG